MCTPDLERLRAAFIAFRVESVELRALYDTHQALFSSGQDVDALLREIAPLFFSDLSRMLVQQWILGVARLTDQARSGRKNPRNNLTAAQLLQQLKALPPEALGGEGPQALDLIDRCNERLDSYRALIKDARDKVVSHADLEVHLSSAVLGEHASAEVDGFLDCLQEFNDLVGNALGEGLLDFTGTGGPGDAYDLIRVLKAAHHAER
ncbi:AbiU2 domain-containing protein [Rubrivivax gelatinosus]|nr:hypothetical protein [Rubrivivax gelatinosus]